MFNTSELTELHGLCQVLSGAVALWLLSWLIETKRKPLDWGCFPAQGIQRD